MAKGKKKDGKGKGDKKKGGGDEKAKQGISGFCIHVSNQFQTPK